MNVEIKRKMDEYIQAQDIHQYRKMLDAADLFIKSYPNGIDNPNDLELGIALFKEMNSLEYITSLRQYENDTDLYREILIKKVKIFRACIPHSHDKLRGLTEMLIGMKENELG